MEPNKLENEIREKLGKREIQPSAQAWDRLDAMLSVQESKVEKKSFPWMQIAAGVILFLGIGYFVFNSTEKNIKENDSNVVVFEDSKKSSNNEIENENNDLVKSPKIITEEKRLPIVYSDSENTIERVNDKSERLKNIRSKEVFTEEKTDSQLAYSEVKNETKDLENKTEQKVIQESKQVIAEVKTPIEKPKLRIDPNSLLDQVDGEIQLTFRQKVMKTITKGYKEAKEAVVSRNQESSINH